MNVTLEYLNELGSFIKSLMSDLNNNKERNNINFGRGVKYKYYRYLTEFMIGFVGYNVNTSLLNVPGATIVASYNTNFSNDIIKEYINSDINLDFFSLSTVLNDDELVELYLCTVLKDLLSTGTSVIAFKTVVIKRYYDECNS